MSSRIFILLFILLGARLTHAQTVSDLQLAQYYYNNAELDKAVGYFEKAYAQDQSKANFFALLRVLIGPKGFQNCREIIAQANCD